MDFEEYRVEYTATALKRLDEILEYIAVTLCNATAAKRLLDDFEEAIDSAAKFPYAMPAVKKQKWKNYRKIFVRQYLAIYRIDEKKKTLYILTFRYAPRILGDSI